MGRRDRAGEGGCWLFVGRGKSSMWKDVCFCHVLFSSVACSTSCRITVVFLMIVGPCCTFLFPSQDGCCPFFTVKQSNWSAHCASGPVNSRVGHFKEWVSKDEAHHPANPQMASQGLGLGVSSVAMLLRCTGKCYRHKKVTTVPSTKYLSLSYALDMPQATFFCCAGTGLLSASDAAD
jgi:hypothetical protein